METNCCLALLLSGMIPELTQHKSDEVDFSTNPISEVDYNSNHSMGLCYFRNIFGVVEMPRIGT